MSNEELLKNEKTLKISISVLIIGSVIILFTGIYLWLTKGKFNAFLAIPFSLAVFLVLNAKSLKEIRKEKKARHI